MSTVKEPPLAITRGAILAYRIFDAGDEIALDAAEKILGDATGGRRLRLERAGAESLVFSVLPLDTALGMRTLALPRTGLMLELNVFARLFDYGAISIRFELELGKVTELSSLIPLCDEIYDSPLLEHLARIELDALVERLGTAITGRHAWRGVETYTVIFVQELAAGTSAADLKQSPALAKLLVGEPGAKNLSAQQRDDVLKHANSYFEDDLVIIDWNSAFVLEPSGSRDIPDILEFATAQLLELRYYDETFDVELARIYDLFAQVRQRSSLFRSPYGRLARGVLRRLVELTEFTERVDNALKIIGDFYLARVYDSAVRRFRIPDWRTSVDGKQALVGRAYDLLKDEVQIRRSTVLELIVILLILFELLNALRFHT